MVHWHDHNAIQIEGDRWASVSSPPSGRRQAQPSFASSDMPELSDDAALLKVEVAGICGTDVKMYAKPPFDDPVIMGHENVGTIAVAGEKFKQLHGVAEGDRVFVEHYVGCYNCEWCRIGEYRHCEATDWRTQPGCSSLWIHIIGELRHALGRLLRVHVPAVECGVAQGARRRHRRARRAGHAAVERHRVGVDRRRRRLRRHRADPGARPARAVPGRGLQAGRGVEDPHQRHHERQSAP